MAWIIEFDIKGMLEEPQSYCDGIEAAIFGELKAVEFYRRTMFGLGSPRHRDEMKHSVKWGFIYNTHGCAGCVR